MQYIIKMAIRDILVISAVFISQVATFLFLISSFILLSINITTCAYTAPNYKAFSCLNNIKISPEIQSLIEHTLIIHLRKAHKHNASSNKVTRIQGDTINCNVYITLVYPCRKLS